MLKLNRRKKLSAAHTHTSCRSRTYRIVGGLFLPFLHISSLFLGIFHVICVMFFLLLFLLRYCDLLHSFMRVGKNYINSYYMSILKIPHMCIVIQVHVLLVHAPLAHWQRNNLATNWYDKMWTCGYLPKLVDSSSRNELIKNLYI